MERGSSFKFEFINDDSGYSLHYDGEVVLVPLYIYQQLVEGTSFSEYFKNPANRGTRKGSGERADAMIIADAVNGATISELLETKYPHKRGGKKRYSRGKIFATLSVNKPEDYQRITDLMLKYPDELGYLGKAVYEWMRGRSKNASTKDR